MTKLDQMAAVAVFTALAGFLCGWTVKGWYEGKKAQQARAERAEDTLAARIRTETAIHDAAVTASGLNNAAKEKLGEIQHEIKKLPPLDAACRPDAGRADRLRDAVNAANSAIRAAARYRTGDPVRGADTAGKTGL
ncbi:MAG: hypothetical protein NC112_05755 [Oxalobacter formigenes]|nr:hypothetical protein [Oxalobacter formigenes]